MERLGLAPADPAAPPPPPGCQPHHSTAEIALSLFLCQGLVVSYLPQIIRIIWKKSSVGFSPWFLFLGATSSASSFLNVVSLQWAIVSCCRWLSYGACFESLLGIVQVGLQWLLFMIVFLLFLVYYPKELRYERSIALADSNDDDDSSSSDSDIDSLDSHIEEHYAPTRPGEASEVSALTPSAVHEGVAVARHPHLDAIEQDDRSSSAFSKLVPAFWPMWKAPRKPSPLKQGDGEAERPSAYAAREAIDATNQERSETQDPNSDTPRHDDSEQHVRIQLPALRRRKRRGTKVRSQEWNLALSLAWLVAFHFIFILSVTLLLVFSLPAGSFPQPPEESDGDTLHALGPSSRLLVNRWATFLGYTAMLLAAFQYLPQIVRTARARIVGSLSIPMMCLQVPGTVLFVYSLALKPGVNYTSLVAYICTGVLQGILLGLCIAWRIRQKRLGLDDYGRPLEATGRDQDGSR